VKNIRFYDGVGRDLLYRGDGIVHASGEVDILRIEYGWITHVGLYWSETSIEISRLKRPEKITGTEDSIKMNMDFSKEALQRFMEDDKP